MSTTPTTEEVERLSTELFGRAFGQPLIADTQLTQTHPWGWVIVLHPPRYIETRAFEDMLIGHGPIFVTRDARFFVTGSGCRVEPCCRYLAFEYGEKVGFFERLGLRSAMHTLLDGQVDAYEITRKLRPGSWAHSRLVSWLAATRER